MVALDIIRACNATLVQTQPLVAVFVGGTAGIGEHSARALAAAHASHGKGLRLYIVGRNEGAARAIISDCSQVCPTGQFRFVRANDLALLSDVDRVCAEIVRAEGAEAEAEGKGEAARVDFLVMTQGCLVFDGRHDTKEGLDMLMSLLYYSRMRFITQLLPLLLASPLPAHVVSVYGPGRDTTIFPDDLSLRDPRHYGFMNMGSHAAYLTTFFLEQLAARHAGRLSLAHYFPSLVWTAAFSDASLPRWFRWTCAALSWAVRPFTVPQMESGERVLFHASPRFPARPPAGTKAVAAQDGNVDVAVSSDGILAGGAYRTNWNGETMLTGKAYGKLRQDGMSERAWDHTMKAFEEIGAGRVFTG